MSRVGLRIERRRHVGAEERDQRRDHDGGDQRAGDAHRRLAIAEDVADAEQRRRHLERELGLRQHRQHRVQFTRHQVGERDHELHGGAEDHAAEDPHAAARGARRSRGRRAQHFGAGRALRVRQFVVRLHDQQPAQRDHRRQAQQAAEERQRHDLQVGWDRTPQEQRRDREDRAGCERSGRGRDRLRHVRLEDRAFPPQQAECSHRHDRGGDGCRDGHSHAQAEVGICGAEDDAEYDADDDGLERELRDISGLLHRRDHGRRTGAAQRAAPGAGRWRAVGMCECRECRSLLRIYVGSGGRHLCERSRHWS